MGFLTSPQNQLSIEELREILRLDQRLVMSLVILFFASPAFAADPNCKFSAFQAANPIPASTIQQQASEECIKRLQQYSNYLGFGKNAANGCSDWEWADRLAKSYGRRIQAEGILFDDIPDLDNPLGKPVTKKEIFKLKLNTTTEGYKGEITSITPSGARCALTVEIARPAGVPAPTPPAATAHKPEKRKKSAVKKKSRGKK